MIKKDYNKYKLIGLIENLKEFRKVVLGKIPMNREIKIINEDFGQNLISK